MVSVNVKTEDKQNTAALQAGMYEALLARGNGDRLVVVHRGQITKITPITREADVCAGVVRQKTGFVENGDMLKRLFAVAFGEYVVTVCYGRIVEIAPVEKEEAVKVQDLTAEEGPAQSAKPGRKKATPTP